MKILYLFNDHDAYMFKWQYFHIVNELKDHGCVIDIFNPLDYSSGDEVNTELLRTLKTIHYDMFMTCLNEQILYIDTLKMIKQLGIPTLLFCPDNLLAPFNHEHISAYFDLVWLTSQETEYIFKKWHCKTIFMPYAANPRYLVPDYSLPELSRVGFIGNPHGSRILRINQLLDAKIPVSVYMKKDRVVSPKKTHSISYNDYFRAAKNYIRYPIGRKLFWASVKERIQNSAILRLDSPYLTINEQIPMEAMAKTNCQYALMLSFSEAKSTGVLKHPVPIVNLRHFEIPMSGGLQFASYTDEIASYFTENKEIVLCHSKQDYIDKAKFYLRAENKELRMKMRYAARCRSEAEHTWYNRFSCIFKKFGMK